MRSNLWFNSRAYKIVSVFLISFKYCSARIFWCWKFIPPTKFIGIWMQDSGKIRCLYKSLRDTLFTPKPFARRVQLCRIEYIARAIVTADSYQCSLLTEALEESQIGYWIFERARANINSYRADLNFAFWIFLIQHMGPFNRFKCIILPNVFSKIYRLLVKMIMSKKKSRFNDKCGSKLFQ